MSWLYSQVLVEEYSEAKCLDGEQCALWNGTHMQQASWLPAKTTKRSTLSRSGMTFKPLTDDLGEAVLMSFLEAFPVRTYPAQEKGPELTESEAVCGDTWQESSMKFDLNTCSWKTHQCLWEEDLPESSVTLPKWGMMRDGVLWERTTLPPLTSGTGFGLLLSTPKAQEPGTTSEAYGDCLNDVVKGRKGWDKKMWPTPRVGGEEGYETVKERKGHSAAVQHNLLAAVQHSQMFPTPQANEDAAGTPECKMQRMLGNCEEVRGKTKEEWATGTLNPTWVEWLMGWPIGWTDLNALETDKFLTWPHSHGDS